jgi:CrcB protein
MPESPSARGAADSHPELPVDSDSLTPKAPHAQPRLLALVAVGGAVGASLRYGLASVLPTAPDGFPTATFVTNVSGAFLLGALLELLARLGPDHGGRRLVRLGLGTGVLGAFTTYSTLAVEVTELGRDGHVPLGLLYGLASAAAGLLAAAAGIAVAALGHRGGRRALAIQGEPADCTDGP